MFVSSAPFPVRMRAHRETVYQAVASCTRARHQASFAQRPIHPLLHHDRRSGIPAGSNTSQHQPCNPHATAIYHTLTVTCPHPPARSLEIRQPDRVSSRPTRIPPPRAFPPPGPRPPISARPPFHSARIGRACEMPALPTIGRGCACENRPAAVGSACGDWLLRCRAVLDSREG